MAQLDWLAPAADALNADGAFRQLGSADVVVGLKSGKAARVVVFEAFTIAEVREADAAQLRDCDIVIEMVPRQWTDYLRRRATGTGPSLVALDVQRAIVQAPNPLARLKFERYHTSLQALLDRGATLAGSR